MTEKEGKGLIDFLAGELVRIERRDDPIGEHLKGVPGEACLWAFIGERFSIESSDLRRGFLLFAEQIVKKFLKK